MIIFKQDEKIAFNGIYVEEFAAGIEYDLNDDKIAELTELKVEFVIAEVAEKTEIAKKKK